MVVMKTDKLLLGGICLLLGGLAAQIALGVVRPLGSTQMASWVNNPRNLQEAKDSSDEIVTGRVARVRRADDLVVAATGEPGGSDAIPVEVVTIQVETRHKGGQAKGETIELFHTGLSKGTPPSERGDRPPGPAPADAKKPSQPPDKSGSASRTIILADDPPYENGERYVLFLRPGPKVTAEGAPVATKRVLSPEGRYKVTAAGKIDPISSRAEFAKKQKDKSLPEFEAELRR
jgi:hypothetical protein